MTSCVNKRRKTGKRKSGAPCSVSLSSRKRRKQKQTSKSMEEREGGPAKAAFPPPAVPPSAGQRGGLQAPLRALLGSLAASACGESASTARAKPSSNSHPFVAARGVFCSAMRGEEDSSSSSLFVLAFAAALFGALVYLTLLAVGRARR